MSNTDAKTRRADDMRRRANELREFNKFIDREIETREHTIATLRAERARAVADFHKESGYTCQMLARLLGRSVSWVSLQNKLSRGEGR